MSNHIREKLGKHHNYKAEAQYYLEVAEYDLAKAMEEFEQDLEFEKEQETKFKDLKGKGKRAQMQPLLFLKK